jgi:hypothetical protein
LASVVLPEWFFSKGIGALWWPGFMLVCVAVAAWLKTRASARSINGESRLAGVTRLNRVGAGIGLPLAALFTLFYAAPGWFVGHIAPAGFDATGFTYADEFRAVRLPALLIYMIANLVLLAFVAFRGPESRATRRLSIAVGLAGIAIMIWCVFGGPMFMLEPVDRLVRIILAIIVFFALIDIAQRVARELILSRRRSATLT